MLTGSQLTCLPAKSDEFMQASRFLNSESLVSKDILKSVRADIGS